MSKNGGKKAVVSRICVTQGGSAAISRKSELSLKRGPTSELVAGPSRTDETASVDSGGEVEFIDGGLAGKSDQPTKRRASAATAVSKKPTKAQLLLKLAALEQELNASKQQENDALLLDSGDESAGDPKFFENESDDEDVQYASQKRKGTRLDSDSESEKSCVIAIKSFPTDAQSRAEGASDVRQVFPAAVSTKMSRCSEQMVNNGLMLPKPVSNVQLMNHISQLENKFTLKDAFGGKSGPFTLYIIATRKNDDGTVLLVRDWRHMTTECEFARGSGMMFENYQSGLLKVGRSSLRPGPNGTILVLHDSEIILQDEQLQDAIDRKFGEPTRLVVGTPDLKKITIFQLDSKLKGVEVNVEVLSQRIGPWKANGKEGDGLYFTCRDATGTARGAIFSQFEDFASKFKVGAKICIKNPLISLADPSYNHGNSTPFELRFSKDTSVGDSSMNFRVERI